MLVSLANGNGRASLEGMFSSLSRLGLQASASYIFRCDWVWGRVYAQPPRYLPDWNLVEDTELSAAYAVVIVGSMTEV
jgi:hypothetical protein